MVSLFCTCKIVIVGCWMERLMCLCAGIWLLSTLFSLPPVFGWSRYEYIRNKAICTIQWSSSYTYAVAVIGLGVFVPFIVMIVAYMRIFSKATDIFSSL